MNREEKVALLKEKALKDTAELKHHLKNDLQSYKENDDKNFNLTAYYYTCLTLLEKYLNSENCFCQTYKNGAYIFPEKYLDMLLDEQTPVSPDNFAGRYLDYVDECNQYEIHNIVIPSDEALAHSDFITVIEVVLYNYDKEREETPELDLHD